MFNDITLFHTERKEWVTPAVNIELPYRFGDSSCSSKNRLFFFGGNEIDGYSDGNMVELVVWKEGEDEEKEEGRHSRGRLRG